MTEVVHEAGLVRDFAIIMVVAAVALVLFRRLGLPPILGYLLAGVLIGPYTFAWPSIGDIDTIRLLADLGLVLILFSLGLEFGWERIRRLGIIILFIGAFEIGVMISLGYGLGLLFGWNGTEAIFLGATMAISSSAILIKVLEGAGQLHGRRGRLIVGLLIVEDFAAVLLLAVLSGVATTGAGTISDVGLLVGKLALFSIAALVFGAIIAPRLIDLVADFGSREILLIASLGMMFGLALLGVELGVSAAAGAFLIGTVLGDTRHANRIGVAINPIRDMFAAIFFVSIGMLVDMRDVADYIGPAAAVAAVFIVGKVVANSAGGLFAGYRGREALAVGTGTPQIGEFSLAIANVGVAQGVVGAALFPVVTIATAFTAVAYPFIFKSSEKTADVLRRYAPAWVRALVNSVQVFGEGVRPRRTAGVPREEVRGPLRNLGLNVAIIIVLVTVGAFVLHSIEGAVETSFFGERIGRGMVGPDRRRGRHGVLGALGPRHLAFPAIAQRGRGDPRTAAWFGADGPDARRRRQRGLRIGHRLPGAVDAALLLRALQARRPRHRHTDIRDRGCGGHDHGPGVQSAPAARSVVSAGPSSARASSLLRPSRTRPPVDTEERPSP